MKQQGIDLPQMGPSTPAQRPPPHVVGILPLPEER